MKTATILFAGAAALAISSAALAQQALTGTVTKVDRVNATVTIQQTQKGSVGASSAGASSGGATEEFKVEGGLLFDSLHAGDKVSFSATGTGGVKTITKIQKQ
jgi:Cu/Ag efflux protein CusF